MCFFSLWKEFNPNVKHQECLHVCCKNSCLTYQTELQLIWNSKDFVIIYHQKNIKSLAYNLARFNEGMSAHVGHICPMLTELCTINWPCGKPHPRLLTVAKVWLASSCCSKGSISPENTIYKSAENSFIPLFTASCKKKKNNKKISTTTTTL